MPAELSVVVPAVNTLGDVIGCLTALEAQSDVQLEILVVDRLGDEVRAEVARRFPSVRILPVPRGTTIPRMRQLAFPGEEPDSLKPPEAVATAVLEQLAGDAATGSRLRVPD